MKLSTRVNMLNIFKYILLMWGICSLQNGHQLCFTYTESDVSLNTQTQLWSLPKGFWVCFSPSTLLPRPKRKITTMHTKDFLNSSKGFARMHSNLDICVRVIKLHLDTPVNMYLLENLGDAMGSLKGKMNLQAIPAIQFQKVHRNPEVHPQIF